MRRSIQLALAWSLLSACSNEPKRAAAVAPTPASISVRAASAAPASGIKRTLIAQGDIADRPGFESRLYLVEYPPSAQAEPHSHTEQCVGYVLEGRFASAFGDRAPSITQAGESFVDLATQPHRFKNLDSARPLRFVIAGTFRKGEPLIVPATGAAAVEPITTTANADAPRVLPGGPLTEVKRTLLTQRNIDDQPGLESRIYLIEFPPAAAAKLHQHSTQGIGYVLEGSFESAFGDGPTTIKHAGEGFVDLANQPHHFKNADAARPLRFIVAGTFHKDEPLFQVL